MTQGKRPVQAPDLRSLKSRALGARLVCGLFILVALVQAYRAGAILMDELEYGYSIFMISLPGMAGPMLAIFAISLLVIAPWVHRAHANLRAGGLSGLSVTPDWAVGSFFVPGANLLVPHGAMRELWNRSHGEEEQDARADVGDVNSWWTCLLVGMAILVFLLAQVGLQRISNIIVMTPVGANTGLLLFAILLLAGSAWFLQRIVAAVTAAQVELFGHLAPANPATRRLKVVSAAEAPITPEPA